MPLLHRSRLLIVCLACLASCTVIRPESMPQPPAEPFSHEAFARVLEQFVDEQGQVDYAGLKADDADLRTYFAQLAAVSPWSHTQLFPTRNHELAYWINAYNATVLVYVIENYPLQSVMDVKQPALLFFFPTGSGFFYFTRAVYGGEKISLRGLEKKVITREYGDPRIHFALNCASGGCPELPQEPFLGEVLDDQLERETRDFLAQEKHLRLEEGEDGARVARLSTLFDWYGEEFLAWSQAQNPQAEPSVLDFVRAYAPAEVAEGLGGSPEVQFIEYDWSLNDKAK